MIDSGWEQWADDTWMPRESLDEFADGCVQFLQKKPTASVKWRIYGNKLCLAVRGEDGTIMAFQADVRAERTIHAE
jgi:hypothetical protein